MPAEPKEIFDPTIKEGDKVKIGDLVAHVASQEEINRESANGNMTCVCMPCSMPNVYIIEGSIKAICGRCRCEVWMSPSSQKAMPVEAFIRCIHCLMRDMESMKDESQSEDRRE